MAKHRFYCPDSLIGPRVELTGTEAHHLLNVLRLGPGQEVELFDGRGTAAIARIEETGRKQATLTVISTQPSFGEMPSPLILATAIPKGERFRWLIEKATELGVTRLIPLQTERSVVDPRSAKLDKMRAAIVAASKQCGRSTLMQLDAPMQWDDFLSLDLGEATRLLGHPGEQSWTSSLVPTGNSTVIAIGPEGGFSEEEIEQAREHGATLVNLGPRILRLETAALALVSLCAAVLEGH